MAPRWALIGGRAVVTLIPAAVGLGASTAGASTTPRHFLLSKGAGPAAAGIVASAPVGDVFTITARSGPALTVDVGDSTTYVERGVSNPSLSNVANGELAAVFGTISGTTVTATEVVIGPPKSSGTFAAAGMVTGTPTSSGFTETTWNGTLVTVDVASSTTYAEHGVSSPSLSSVTSGEFVGVFGTTSGSMVSAIEVVIAGSQHQGMFGFGRPSRFGRGFGHFGLGRSF